MEKEKYYLVMTVKTELKVSIEERLTELPLPLIWADGMFGAIPVFQDRESAEKYADGKAEVVPLYLKNNTSETINLGEN